MVLITRDIIPSLATSLTVTPLTATLGAYTLTFTWLQWGKHWDRRNYAQDRGLITARTMSNPTRVSNIGSGARRNVQFVDVVLAWEDHASITDDLASFKQAVQNAFISRINTIEKTLTPAYYVEPVNVVDTSALLGTGSTSMKNEILITLRAPAVDVYA